MATKLARRMTKRGRNGAGSRQWHLVEEGASRYRRALCGTRPAATGAMGTLGILGKSGWSEKGGSEITCPKCIAAERLAERKAA
jgi:hypothetical protein